MASEDIEQDIVITCDGSGAASSLGNVSQAFDDVGESASNMGSAMQHSGVHLLNHELLGMVGLGGQARATMGLMTSGLEGLAAAFGTTLTVMAPWLLAIGAGILAWEHFSKASKETEAELDAAKQKTDAMTSSLVAFYQQQEKVSAAGKELAGIALGQLKDKIRETEQTIRGYNAELDGSAQKHRELQQESGPMGEMFYAMRELWSATGKNATKASEEQIAAQQKTRTDLALSKASLEEMKTKLSDLDALAHGTSTTHVESVKKATDADAEWDKQMRELSESFNKEYRAMESSVDKFIRKNDEKNQKMNSGPEKDDKYTAQYDAQVEASNAAYDEMEQKAQSYGASTVDLEKSRTQTLGALRANYDQKVAEDMRASFGLQKSAMDDFAGVARSTAATFESGFSRAFAEMVVNGKNLTQAMHQLFKTMEVDIIQSLVEIAMKDVAMKTWAAITGTTTTATAASTQTGLVTSAATAQTSAISTAIGAQKLLYASLAGTVAYADSLEMGPPGIAAAPGVAATAYAASLAAATGMDSIVDRPTTILTGEAGAERVTVTPLGQAGGGGGSGGGGGGGGSQPISIAVSVQAAGVVTDIAAFSNMVGQAVVKQVRGQGQLQFTRNA